MPDAPPDGDRRGSAPQNARPGPPAGNDRGGSPPGGDRGGSRPDDDRPGSPPDGERRGADQAGGDRGGSPPDGERPGSLPDGDRPDTARIRIAAAGDLHCREDARRQVADTLAQVAAEVDLVLLCGDLTTHGEPEQGSILADACAGLEVPVLAVLGNHDWHANRADDLIRVLNDGGIDVLERSSRVLCLNGIDVGVVGCKGFVGGFSGSSHLPDFGEPLLRRVYAETTLDVEALDHELRQVALCPVRVVMLHYAPTTTTIQGEPVGIWAFLGSDRLAAPIAEHEPDMVVHGHAHAGTFEGAIGGVPVYNVSVPVIGRDFWIFELERQRHPGPAIH